MRILVCLKQTFDTEEKIVIQNGKIKEDGVNFIINPYDEYALEEAIRLKESSGGEVTVISFGPERVESALRSALAVGADKAILIDEDEASVADEYMAAKLLAAAARQEGFDLILCGYMAVDGGSAQIGPRLAEELGIPSISSVVKLQIEAGKVIATKDAEGDTEVIESVLPLLITAQQGLNEPRYPSLPGIMKAKKKTLERLTAAGLGVIAAENQAKTLVTEQFAPAKRTAGKILEGDMNARVRELVGFLRREEKII